MSKTDEMAPPGPGPEAAGPARIDKRDRIDKEICRGGMGRVFVAHDRKLGRDVAIKVLASGLHGEEALRRFEQEARATCALSHANILDVHDIGTHDGSPYIVSELLHGSTLRERLQQGALPPAEATGYAVLSADPPELPAEVPAALKRIVQRCLEKEPARRFQSATDLVVALTATSGAPAEKSRWRWAAVVIVLVAVAAAGWFLWHES